VTTIVVLSGDQTGQELLDEALRVVAPDVIGVELELQTFDLSLANRRETNNAVVVDAADAMLAAGFGLKAATVTPTDRSDVGSPNALLRERVGGRVILRTGQRIPGVAGIAGVSAPISIVRMAVDDAYNYGESDEHDNVAHHAAAFDDYRASQHFDNVDRDDGSVVVHTNVDNAEHHYRFDNTVDFIDDNGNHNTVGDDTDGHDVHTQHHAARRGCIHPRGPQAETDVEHFTHPAAGTAVV